MSAEDCKIYVPVQADFDASGRMVPRRLRWTDGEIYEIDRVLDLRPAAAQKAGGQGDRYTVRIREQETFLFFEHDPDGESGMPGRWFVERKDSKMDNVGKA